MELRQPQRKTKNVDRLENQILTETVINQLEMRSKYVGIGLILTLLLVSCGEQPMFEKSYSFKSNSWSQKVKPAFKIAIDDTTKAYDFTITFRVTTDYAYNNVWFYLNTKTPDGITAREPFEIKITNPDGTWAGVKTGTVVETNLNFNRRKLPKKGNYYFTLEQGVTMDKLDEVLDIGLKVEEAK
jgi:gliding motility-associated lipoprotein GldH